MLKASARVCRRRLSRIPTCWLRSQAARLQCPCRVRRRRCRTGCGGCPCGDLSGAHRLHARRLDRGRRHHHRRQRQSGDDVLLSRRRMPEWGRPGGEWRWRVPSAKQLSGLSGICRLNSVQASHGMASSRRVSGDISGAGLRCPVQPDRAGACWMLDISDRTGKIERQWVVQCILA